MAQTAAGRDLTVSAGGGGFAAGIVEGLTVPRYPAAPGRPVFLAPRPVVLAGREQLLASLDSRLAGNGGVGPRVVALYGLGGAGKTSVAVEYAHRHLGTAGIVWQFPAESQTVLAGEFTRLAAQLGAVGGVMDPRDPVASVHAVLADSPTPWLLVFDNAPDQESVRGFLPPAGDGRVLITSRSSLWPPGQAVAVPVLDVETAAGFLVARTGDPDGEAAVELAAELDGLPLALEQAGAYIQATTGTLAVYLGVFRQRRPELLARGEVTGYGERVATTWAVAFGRLEQDAPQAVGLLRLLACCAPEAVPLTLLLQPRPGLADKLGAEVALLLVPLLDDMLAAGDAIAELRRYSLVTPAGDGSVSMHRLVQTVTVSQMPTGVADQWRRAAAALIEAATPGDLTLPETWPVCALLLPHAQAALADDSPALDRLANYLGQRGSYASAIELRQRVLEARERSLGPEHPSTLNARGDFAYWTGEAGDAAGARDQFAALVPVCEQVLGPEHPDTLNTRHNLASQTGEAGDAAGARDQFAALLPAYERVQGAEHTDTLLTRHNLAYWTGEAGDAAGARDQFAALVPVCEQVLGPEHPDTLNARFSLARWTGQAGDAAGARDQSAALLPVRERVLGPEHVHTLATRASLARWTGQAGDAAGARDQFAALLPVDELVLGAEHRETLVTRNNLAFWTGEAGDGAGARDQLAALVPAYERVLGLDHPETLVTRNNLAFWTGEAGDAAGARDQLAALVPAYERVLGLEHPETLVTGNNLAYWTGQAAPGSE